VMSENGRELAPGLFLGRYRLVERLGMGASAAVWRALDEPRGREVALKVLHEHLAADGSALPRLRAEASAATAVSHPSIVPLLAAHLDGPRPALAFEYVAGETLADRLRRDGRLDPHVAAAILAPIADALAHAHLHGLVHRDVKPSNVLLGADGRSRLLDFGISGQVDRAGLDEAGTAAGTLPYIAPEQLAGQPPHPASDVFALGAVLYQAISGRPPYPADDGHALARAQLVPPSPLGGVARAAALVALAALSHAATERPRAEELARRLGVIATEGPVDPSARSGGRRQPHPTISS
jgi:eukaryotic-like serine/threonine-protein kinase